MPPTSSTWNAPGARRSSPRHETAAWGAPGFEGDEVLVSWLASYMRRSASPSAAISLKRMP